MIADTFWYLTGRRFGTRVLRTLCRISLSPDSCVRQTESIFERFGPASMLFAKFVPGLRVGRDRDGRRGRPALLEIRAVRSRSARCCGSASRSGSAYLFRDAIADILETLQSLGKYGLVLVVAALAAWIAAKWWRRRQFVRQLRMDRVTVGRAEGDDGRGRGRR